MPDGETRALGGAASGGGPIHPIGLGTIISTGGEDWLLIEELGGGGMARVFRSMPLMSVAAAWY